MNQDFANHPHLHKDIQQLQELLDKVILTLEGESVLMFIYSLREGINLDEQMSFDSFFAKLESCNEREVLTILRFFGLYLGLLTIVQRVYKVLAYEHEKSFELSLADLSNHVLPQLHLVFCRHSTEAQSVDITWSFLQHIFDILYHYRKKSYEPFDLMTLEQLYVSLENLVTYPLKQKENTLEWSSVQLGLCLKHSLFPSMRLLLKDVHPADLPKLPKMIRLSTWIGGDYTDPLMTNEIMTEAENLYSIIIHQCYSDSIKHLQALNHTTNSMLEARLSLLSNILSHAEVLSKDAFLSFKKNIDETIISLKDDKAMNAIRQLLSQLRAQVEVFGSHGLELEVRFETADLVSLFENIYQKSYRRRLLKLFQDSPQALLKLAHEIDKNQLNHIIHQLSPEHKKIWNTLIFLMGRKRIILSNLKSLYDLICIRSLLELLPQAQLSVTLVFEQIDVIQNAQSILSAYLQACRAESFDLLFNQIMLGYTISTQEVGFLAAQTIIYHTQRDLTRWAEKEELALSFFQGRGGSVASGGFPTTQLIASSQISKELPFLKLTLEGETIQQRFGNPQVAAMSIKRYLEEIRDAALKPDDAAHSVQAKSLREKLASLSLKEFTYYTQEEQDFYDYYRSVSPFEFVVKNKKDYYLPDSRNHPQGWYVCWSQNRFFLPMWLGMGAVCTHLDSYSALELKNLFKDKFLYAIFMLMLVSLEKIDKIIIHIYERELVSPHLREIGKALNTVYQQVRDLAPKYLDIYEENPYFNYFVQDARYRATYMVPLHLIQIEMLRRYRSEQDHAQTQELMFLESVLLISIGLQNSG